MLRRLIAACLVMSVAGIVAAQDPVTERPEGSSRPLVPMVAPATEVPIPAPMADAPIPAPTPASKPTPVPVPAPQPFVVSLPGSLWLGKEEFNNQGQLILGLRRDGSASMRDAQSLVQGRWTSQGNEVTLTFRNCVYRGKVQGRSLVGRAQFVTGPETGKSWAFAVDFADAFAGSTYEGRETLNGFGALAFRFGLGGEAEMIDAQSTAKGRYLVDVNAVTITFRNCVYRGQIEADGRLVGWGRYTDGSQGAPWTFVLSSKK